MSASASPSPARTTGVLGGRIRITTRGVQVALGVIWLIAGVLQFQSFMYTHGVVSEVFAPAAQRQWSIVASTMHALDRFYGSDLTLWNTLAAEIQTAIGLGLILSRKTVKPALFVSFGWALAVWWFGEGFGGLTSNTLPSPLMGAPGGVILYAIVGLLVWPTERPDGRSAAAMGPLGERGGLCAWSGLWVLCAGLWLANVNRGREATHDMIEEMAQASPHWLAGVQSSLANDTQGHGAAIAIALAALSVAVAAGVWTRLRWPALVLGMAISLAYWVFGQSLGGPFWVGDATDVNAAPLFVLLAVAIFPVAQRRTARAPSELGASDPAWAVATASERAP